MNKIKKYLSSIGWKRIAIYLLIISLLIGGGIYLYKRLSSKKSSEDTSKEEVITKKADFASKEIMKVIPKESAFVMSLIPSTFLDKMEIEDLLETELGEELEDFFEKADSDILEDLFEDPSVSGIDYLSEVFVFHSYQDVDEHYICISAGVEDDKKFGEFLEDIAKENGDRIKIKEEDDFYYFTEETIGIVWDDDKFIYIAGLAKEDDLEDHMAKLMTLEEDDRLTSNEDFNTFYENKKDINVWISTELLDEFADDFEGMLEIFSDDFIEMYDDCIWTNYIEFGDGEIIYSSELMPNDYLQDLEFHQEFNSEILEFIPENNLFLLSAAMNVDALSWFFMEGVRMGSESDLDDLNREMRNEIGLDLDDLIHTFGGSFIANISGFGEINTTITNYDYWMDEYITKDTTFTLPLFSVVFDMRDSKFLESMIEEGFTYSSYDGYYSIDADGMDMFMDIENDIFILTNDKDAVNKFNKGGYRDNLSSSNQITDNIAYIYLNLDMDEYSDAIQEWSGGSIPSSFMDIWDNLFESMDIKQSYDESSGNISSEFKITFKDKDQNVLQTIYELLEDKF